MEGLNSCLKCVEAAETQRATQQDEKVQFAQYDTIKAITVSNCFSGWTKDCFESFGV